MRGTDADAMHPAEAIGRGLGDIYDFGGDWEHRLVLTNIRQGKPGIG